MAQEPVAQESELLAIADRERVLTAACNDPSVEGTVAAIEKAAEIVGKAWGGSWLGCQSRVYYKGLKSPPTGGALQRGVGLYGDGLDRWRNYGRLRGVR
jgi:hypothetical protein